MRFSRLTFAYIVLLAALIQLVVITYNSATGHVTLSGPVHFLVMLAVGTALTTLMAAPLVYLDYRIILLLDRVLLWDRHFGMRLVVEGFTAGALAVPIGIGGTIFAHALFPYSDGLWKNVTNNALIAAVVNVPVMAGVEALLAFTRHREARDKSEQLEKENARVRFETLKNQLNPHFLFNSLNVLSSLIKKDAGRAQDFVDEFSSVYRYTLDVIDRPVVDLRSELEFARSYLYLQEMRFQDAVTTDVQVGAELMDRLLPPLALQVVLENAFKHNRASTESPLRLRIATDGGRIVISNNLQPRLQRADSSGVGLENLRKRYAYVCAEQPQFTITNTEYIATLPLIPAQ